MRFFPFKILVLCILVPPAFYIFTAQYLEQHIKVRYTEDIKEIYAGNVRFLFEGSMSLKDALSINIPRYLNTRKLIRWGVKPSVVVATTLGTILYPPVSDESEYSLESPDPLVVAAENYRLMNEGIVVHVSIKLGHNTPLSSVILGVYIGLSLLVLYFFYMRGLKKMSQEEIVRSREIDRLVDLEELYKDRLRALGQKRVALKSRIANLKRELEDEKQKASRTEDDMLEEIILLEKEINKNIALQEDQQHEIEELVEKIENYEQGNRKIHQKLLKGAASYRKRFRILYKNISVHKKAVNGFCGLSEDMKIKGEEVIHQLNENSEIVQIKRKVFSKKSKETVYEVIFAYKGRLYFQRTKDKHIEVLVIGTKNTQTKDLEFINSL